MAVKMNLIARCLSILAISVSVLFLNSCLSLDTDVKLRKDGSVDAVLTYVISSDAAVFGRGFGADESWPLPLTEKDFQQRSLRMPEVKLKRYRVRISSDGVESIVVTLKAESMDALAAYLDIDIRISQDSDSGSLVLRLPVTDDYLDADEDVRVVLDDVVGSSEFSFSFQPPSTPLSVNFGLIDRKKATVDISMSDLLYGNVQKSWEVSW